MLGQLQTGSAAAPWLIDIGFALGFLLGVTTLNWLFYFEQTRTLIISSA